ncbi:hypothetical protein AYL99_00104 [Fonsecaea erecta]|uniref:Glycosyltransferase 2-like domain-containing protein n=1 Tax=Fonsecaea erecta TaxID=1367422 RepID=A0A178ZWR4_9EURO|nr:hypothetical protein AYL99_00104 [Fonsecaea erecta]OAP64132.1 hypothetical protein AYL99_00104 [Fonsecaea erecta]
MDSTTWFKFFIGYFLWRYVRLIVNLWAFWTFKPIPIPENPTLWPSDVTVILPTLDGEGEELEKTIASIMENEPKELILVTIDENLAKAERTMGKMPAAKYHRIRCMSVKHANKRRQMARAIPEVTTEIIVFADDDVTWPPRTLQWMLAPFEDKKYGGVVTCQRLRRAENPTFSQRIYGFLGALYLERRNFDCAATTHIDGGVPCLSGRTCAYRTSILQDVNFTNGFTNEKWWFGQFQLNADDDNFLTRWMVSHRHEIYMQYHPECEVLTTLEDNPKFLKQCLRWARSNWRSNLTSMLAERHIWRRQPYSTYAVQVTTLMPPAIIGDGLLWLYLCKGIRDWPVDQARTAIYAFAAWMIFSKFIKLVTHFVRYPVDILLWPVSILFGWFHGAIKVYAGVTLGVTTWGSRPNADASDSGRMIRQKKPHCYELEDEKLHEKLLPNDEMMTTYANDQKHYQPPSA